MKKLKQLWTVNLRLKTFSLRPGIHTYSDIFEKGDFFPCFQKKYASTRSVESLTKYTSCSKHTKNEKLAYSKFFTVESLFSLKRCVFDDRFHPIRVVGRPNHPEKKYPYSNKHGYVWTGPNLQTRPLCHSEMLKDTRCWVFKQVRISQFTGYWSTAHYLQRLLLLTET